MVNGGLKKFCGLSGIDRQFSHLRLTNICLLHSEIASYYLDQKFARTEYSAGQLYKLKRKITYLGCGIVREPLTASGPQKRFC
jgi:hypothetical protein